VIEDVREHTLSQCGLPRRDAVFINRLKIGHSRLTHSYLLSGDDQPTCTKCDAVLTVKHILLDCPELRDVRLKYLTASSLKDILKASTIKLSLILLKTLIFIINFRACYLHFIPAIKPCL